MVIQESKECHTYILQWSSNLSILGTHTLNFIEDPKDLFLK